MCEVLRGQCCGFSEGTTEKIWEFYLHIPPNKLNFCIFLFEIGIFVIFGSPQALLGFGSVTCLLDFIEADQMRT